MPGILGTKQDIKYITTGVVGLSLFACVLHISGYVTPGWTVLKVVAVGNETNDPFTIAYHSSLWYITVCSDSNCLIKPIFDVKTENRLNWIYYTIIYGITAHQTETTVALGLTIVAIVLLVIILKSRRSDFTSLCLLMSATTCHLIAGIAALVASGTKTQNTMKWKDAFDLYFPFSVLLIGLAGIINIITLLLSIRPLVFIYHVMQKPTSQRESLMTAYPPQQKEKEPIPPKYQKPQKSSKYQTGQLRNWQHTAEHKEMRKKTNDNRYEETENVHNERYEATNRSHKKGHEENLSFHRERNMYKDTNKSHNERYDESNISHKDNPKYKHRSHNDRHEETNSSHKERFDDANDSHKKRTIGEKTSHKERYKDTNNPRKGRSKETKNSDMDQRRHEDEEFGFTRPSSYYEKMESQFYAYDNRATDITSAMESCV